jgi:hypothetical protein
MPLGFSALDRDPFSGIDRAMERPFRGLGFGRAGGPEYRQEFDPETYQSKQNALLGMGMSGLRGIGWALSTPGDYARGALSGHLGERKSGRDLLNQFGLTSKYDKGWGAWGAGLAADIATDPLTYLTAGAKHAFTPAGAALAKLAPAEGGIQALSRSSRLGGFQGLESELGAAGRTAEEIKYLNRGGKLGSMQYSGLGRVATAAQEAQVAKELGRPLQAGEAISSLFRVGLPFGYGPQLNLFTGPMAQKIAGKMDVLGNALRFGNPVSRGFGQALGPSVQGTKGAISQRAYALPGGGTDVMKAASARGAEQIEPIHRELEALLRANPKNPAYESELLRAMNAVAERAPVSHYAPGILQEATPLGEKLRKLYEGNIQVERAAGASTKMYQNPWGLSYTHRQAIHGVPGEPLDRLRTMPVHMNYDMARNRNLAAPGGTDVINRWTQAGLADKAVPVQAARTKIFADSLKDLVELKKLGTYQGNLDLTAMMGLWDQSLNIAKELRKTRGILGETGKGPLFAQNPIELATSYMNRSARKQGSLEAVLRSIGEGGVQARSLPAGAGVSVRQLLRRMGMKTWAPEVPGQPAYGAGVKALEAMAPKGAPLADTLARALKTRGPNAGQPTSRLLNKALNRFVVPNDLVKEITASKQVGQLPEELKGLQGLGSSFTNAFRALAYPLWPASHIRNAMTAYANMLRTDTPWGALKSLGEQWREMRNPNFADPALAASRASQHAHGGVGSGFGTFSETAGMNLPQRMAVGGRVTPLLPQAYHLGPEGKSVTGTAMGDAANLMLNEGLLGTAKNIGKTVTGIASDPWSKANLRSQLSQNLGIKGVGGQIADTLPAVRSGWRMGENVENLFRGAQMKSLLRQGFSPEEAGRQMLKFQFDYGAHGFTPFERNVMRQVFPFYCVPDDCEILTRRGWATYDQLLPGEEVLSLDHETGNSSWHKCYSKVIWDYDGVLMTVGGKRGEFAFTPNHRWPVLVQTAPSTGYAMKREFKLGYELRSNHRIPRTSKFEGEDSIATPKEAAIIGWLVTDGHMKHAGNHVGMTIYQSPSKYLDEIIDLLGEDGRRGNPHPETGVVPMYLVGETRRRIAELLPAKARIVEFACRLSRKAAGACYDAMKKAEGGGYGSYQKTGYLNGFSQLDGPVLDAFQILAQLCGELANKCKRGAYVSAKQENLKVAGALGTTWYKGRVWCPQTQTGTWLMRRKGRIIWTGNSFIRKNIPLQMETLATRPGITGSQVAPMMQNRNTEGDYIPQYLQGNVSAPLGPEQEGKQRFISTFGLPAEEAFGKVQLNAGAPMRSLGETALGFASNLNPAIKGMLESLTNRQFFSGRQLSDLRPPTAAQYIGGAFGGENPDRDRMIAQVLLNSPLTRMVTSAERLGDPRKEWWAKALNLGTGIRVTDVDVARQKAIETRDAVQQELAGMPHMAKYTNYYPRPDQKALMTPAEIEAMRVLSTQQAQAAQYAEHRRAQAAAGMR